MSIQHHRLRKQATNRPDNLQCYNDIRLAVTTKGGIVISVFNRVGTRFCLRREGRITESQHLVVGRVTKTLGHFRGGGGGGSGDYMAPISSVLIY